MRNVWMGELRNDEQIASFLVVMLINRSSYASLSRKQRRRHCGRNDRWPKQFTYRCRFMSTFVATGEHVQRVAVRRQWTLIDIDLLQIDIDSTRTSTQHTTTTL